MSSELLSKLIEFFQNDEESPNFQLVYLFGSRITGETGPQSDYDFAILFSREPGAGKISGLKHRLAEFLDTDRIDLVTLNRCPVEIRYNVVATGRILYEASRAAFVEFEAETLSFYFDSLPVLRRHRTELLEDQNHEAGVRRYRAALGKTQELLDQIRAT